MKVFVGYGYNDRDKWIEDQVFPILRCAGYSVAHGKDMHGQLLQPEVQRRMDQADVVLGFLTIREGAVGDFTSHIWVRDELLYAIGRGKPVVPVREDGVAFPAGLFGNRQYVTLRQDDRLGCVVSVMEALGRRNMRRVRLDPAADALRAQLWQWHKTPGFAVRYRTQDSEGMESEFRDGRLEPIDQGFYLNLSEVPNRAYVWVDGVLNGAVQFTSGWVTADAVQIRIF